MHSACVGEKTIQRLTALDIGGKNDKRPGTKKEKIVDALGNDGNASMPEQANRPNPWRKMMMMMMMINIIKLPT